MLSTPPPWSSGTPHPPRRKPHTHCFLLVEPPTGRIKGVFLRPLALTSPTTLRGAGGHHADILDDAARSRWPHRRPSPQPAWRHRLLRWPPPPPGGLRRPPHPPPTLLMAPTVRPRSDRQTTRGIFAHRPATSWSMGARAWLLPSVGSMGAARGMNGRRGSGHVTRAAVGRTRAGA
jgi:hypothetical protein